VRILSFVLVRSAIEGRGRGSRFLDREQFVNAIAPKGDLTRIGRTQFATLFRVADVAKRGLLSWDDFVVFQTLLKRPDADYYIAFQYFDVDGSGTITFDEFKSVFSAEIGPDAIPFNFDWCVLAVVLEDWTRGAEWMDLATGSSST